MLETGPHTKDDLDRIQPARYFPALAKGGEAYAVHAPKPSDKVLGRSCATVAGRCVGGGSAVNCMFRWCSIKFPKFYKGVLVMVYSRTSASDFDDWANVYGNKGWDAKSLMPLIRKVRVFSLVVWLDLIIGRLRPTKPSRRMIPTESLDLSKSLLRSQGAMSPKSSSLLRWHTTRSEDLSMISMDSTHAMAMEWVVSIL